LQKNENGAVSELFKIRAFLRKKPKNLEGLFTVVTQYFHHERPPIFPGLFMQKNPTKIGLFCGRNLRVEGGYSTLSLNISTRRDPPYIPSFFWQKSPTKMGLFCGKDLRI